MQMFCERKHDRRHFDFEIFEKGLGLELVTRPVKALGESVRLGVRLNVWGHLTGRALVIGLHNEGRAVNLDCSR